MRVEIEDNARDLDMDQWAAAQSDDLLETGGASACGIVAIVNHTQALAWMVHQNAPYMTTRDTCEMLNAAAAAAQSGDDIEIHLAGCGQGSTQAASRAALVRLVSTTFPTISPQKDWCKEGLVVEFDGHRWQVS